MLTSKSTIVCLEIAKQGVQLRVRRPFAEIAVTHKPTMISHERKLIFVHIPKTAGGSIEDVIWPGERSESELWDGFIEPFRNRFQTGGLQHLCAYQIRAIVGPATFESYYKFTVVRNTWDRIVSQYHYTIQQRADLLRFLEFDAEPSFQAYVSRIQKIEHVQWMQQYKFITDPSDGSIIVDEIIQYEALSTDWKKVASAIGVTSTLPRTNVSKHFDYRSYYDQETKEAVRTHFSKDIELFSHTF